MKLLTKAAYTDAVSEREKHNLDIAYRAALEAIVMLENNNALPFEDKKVALYGAGIAETIKGGTGSGEVNERHSVSILEGFKADGFDILNERLHIDYKAKYEQAQVDFVKNQRKKLYLNLPKMMTTLFEPFQAPDFFDITEDNICKSTDNCVYVLSRQAGEGGDRKAEKGDFYITDRELQDIKLLSKAYNNFVLIINCGSQMDMSFLDEIENIGAVLFICQLGTQGGKAVADICCGKATPSGKLADTWAKKYSDIPFSNEYSYLNGNLKDEYYKEGLYVGYRYFDSFGVEPRYPFGYGLSYTDFDIRCKKVSLNKTKVTIDSEVKNIGKQYSGKEVLQVYISSPKGKLDKEYQSLIAFVKTKMLAPGESQDAKIDFDLSRASSYRESDASYVLEQGDYIVRLGNSSRNTNAVAVLNFDNEVIVSKHTNICPTDNTFDELTSPERKAEDLSGVEVINVDTDAFDTVVIDYTQPEECKDERVQKILNSLSVNDMAEICVGIGMFGGKTGFTLPGSVGNTTSKFWDKGLANVALCDGPAGIRIQKRSAVTKGGKVKTVDSALGVFDILMPDFVKKAINGNPDKDTLIYQYVTAFPVASAVAQTWNTDIVYEIGKAVYAEMKEYGCTYWLAPAVNIHRNPLCGRNFEYYSEDPYLTGEMVAAMTQGVQQEDGFYVTVKHFACNNQEDNRNKVCSHVSERVLREIYLRGFETAVCKGHAKSIMTAYNKINGTYCANSHDLCTKVLRNEWKFDGVVMTDWFASMLGNVDDALCMSAGNDLIMPGGSVFKQKIIMAVKTGKITLADLRRCCSNVIKSILNSDIQKEYIDDAKK